MYLCRCRLDHRGKKSPRGGISESVGDLRIDHEPGLPRPFGGNPGRIGFASSAIGGPVGVSSKSFVLNCTYRFPKRR